jgi:hypothetical protein
VKVHDTLIDLNVYNNLFYNNAIKQLNLKLNKYNFKFSHNFNINLNLDENYNKININKDTILLNDIFEK